MQQLIGQVVIGIGLSVMAFGVYAIIRLGHFYSRLVITSKVETMGFIIVLLGAMILTGFSLMTLKIFIIMLFELVTLPVASHAIARSAYVNGFRPRTAGRPPAAVSASPGEHDG
ncbi:MAG: cation:proton antiporter [Spirochaetia bacterium]